MPIVKVEVNGQIEQVEVPELDAAGNPTPEGLAIIEAAVASGEQEQARATGGLEQLLAPPDASPPAPETFESTANVGPELTDPITRFRLNQANINTPAERLKVIQDRFPNAEIREVPDERGRRRLLVKPQGENVFMEVDQPGFTPADLVDVAGGTLPELSGELAGMAALGALSRRSPGGAAAATAAPLVRSGIRNVLGGAIGAGTARLLESQISPFEQGGLGENLGQAASAAGESAFFGGLGETIGAFPRAVARFGVRPEDAAEVAKANDVAKSLGLPPITSFEANVGSQSLVAQAISTSPDAQFRDLSRLILGAEAIQTLRRGVDAPEVISRSELEGLSEAITKEFSNLASDLSGGVTRGETNKLLQGAARDFEEVRRAVHKREYSELRRIAVDEGLTFNLRKPVTADGMSVLDSIGAVRRGQVADAAEAGAAPIQIGNPLPSDLEAILEQIERIDPILQSTDSQGYDTMRELASLVADHRTRIGTSPQLQRDLGQLEGALREVLRNPDGAPEAGRAYRRQLDRANKKFDETRRVRERFGVKNLLDSVKDPIEGGKELLKPGNPGRLRATVDLLKKAGRSEDIPIFRQGLINELLLDPTTTVKKMDNMRREGVEKLLFDRPTAAAVRNIGSSLARAEKKGIVALARQQQDFGRVALESFLKGEPEDILRQVNAAGGKNSDLGKMVRAGIFQNIWESAVKPARGGRVIVDKQRVQNIVLGLKKTGGARELFTRDEFQRLDGLSTYFSFLADAGMGESLARTSAASAVAQPLNPIKAIGAAGTFTRNSLIGRLAISPGPANRTLNRLSVLGLRGVGSPRVWVAMDDIFQDTVRDLERQTNEEDNGGFVPVEFIGNISKSLRGLLPEN